MRPAYTVAWSRPLLERTVAEFVVRAMEDGTGATPIALAMAEIDAKLSTRPAEVGESRGGNERILCVSPLAVTYEVREADRIVSVLRASYLPRPPAR